MSQSGVMLQILKTTRFFFFYKMHINKSKQRADRENKMQNKFRLELINSSTKSAVSKVLFETRSRSSFTWWQLDCDRADSVYPRFCVCTLVSFCFRFLLLLFLLSYSKCPFLCLNSLTLANSFPFWSSYILFYFFLFLRKHFRQIWKVKTSERNAAMNILLHQFNKRRLQSLVDIFGQLPHFFLVHIPIWQRYVSFIVSGFIDMMYIHFNFFGFVTILGQLQSNRGTATKELLGQSYKGVDFKENKQCVTAGFFFFQGNQTEIPDFVSWLNGFGRTKYQWINKSRVFFFFFNSPR